MSFPSCIPFSNVYAFMGEYKNTKNGNNNNNNQHLVGVSSNPATSLSSLWDNTFHPNEISISFIITPIWWMKKLKYKRLSSIYNLIQPQRMDSESDSRAYIPNHHILLHPTKSKLNWCHLLFPWFFFFQPLFNIKKQTLVAITWVVCLQMLLRPKDNF